MTASRKDDRRWAHQIGRVVGTAERHIQKEEPAAAGSSLEAARSLRPPRSQIDVVA